MVSAHGKAGFDPAWLESTFTMMTFCSGIAAIVGGVIASVANDIGGPVAPFDASMLVLVAVFVLVSRWKENTGTSDSNLSSNSITNAFQTVAAAVHTLVSGMYGMCPKPPPSRSSSLFHTPACR